IDLKANCDKLYVVGFSMGGMIAAYLAANYDVDKLVLLSTARKYVSFKYLSAYIADAVGDSYEGKLEENEWYRHYKSKVSDVPLKANVASVKDYNRTET